MYLDYWSLERAPFDALPDSRSFFAAPQHEQALAVISYAVCDTGEPVLVTGPAGCGKTLLLRTLRRQLLPDRYRVVFVPELSGADVGLLRRVAYNLVHTVPPDTANAMDLIVQAVAEAQHERRSIVTMLDDWPVDAQPQALNELRWLLNLDLDSSQTCLLFTSDTLDPQTHWPPWLRQRLLTTVTLAALQPDQVPAYLEHRLRAAGHRDGTLFTAAAAAAIAEWSQSVPRLVNRLAHLALQVGCLQLAKGIDEHTVEQAIQRLTRFQASPAATVGAAT